MVSQHLLDCLAVVPHVTARDASSTSAAAPGCPASRSRSRCRDSRVTLLESSHKKAAFLQQAVIELKLDNVAVVCERVEAWQPGGSSKW